MVISGKIVPLQFSKLNSGLPLGLFFRDHRVCWVCEETLVQKERRDIQVFLALLDLRESRERKETEVCPDLMGPADQRERL